MKVITTNLLNRFWKNGVKPIKEAVSGKLDASKVVNSLLATEEGFALDATQGKILKEQVDELNRKLNVSASDIISFTPLAGQTYPNWGGCYYYTSGSRVHVHLGIQGLPANTVATVFILPDIVHPKTRILSIGSSGSFPGVARTEISLDGGINVTSQDSYVAADIDYDTY